ncbi:HD domain-containing protein [Rhodopirellula sallentina]|uniref:Metal dependent phosphohydrolase n=1 Tax=Rhodopirellula sallentina SM41 TaxID=1263870 RepID=M5TTM8_9BACT|nr:HD domain-containing protein [Rhodopirellula sallentina]EMI52515.1 metal dependent phosphohydrolase [Rhodopirellula sallentina SM41]
MLPEITALRRGVSRVRIPQSLDVPMTQRVRRIVDTAPIRHLSSISQLGLVSLVYPGATHTRLEHSLGVYSNALRLLDHLASFDSPTNEIVSQASVAQEAFIVAALVHDAGHWPFCHPIEDMGNLSSRRADGSNILAIKHEDRVDEILRQTEIASCLEQDWACCADDVMAILRPKSLPERPGCQLSAADVSFYASCLSGPIDIDKLDYLQRDSLHAGVPYGRNFDAERIIASLCIHPTEPKLAITEKGRTAAEMMVFGRYVMFSEVYWHHTVRAATAMLQRVLFSLLHESSPVHKSPPVHEDESQNAATQQTNSSSDDSLQNIASWSHLSEPEWIHRLRTAAAQPCKQSESSPTQQARAALAEGLFGPTRGLWKRAAEFNVESGGEVHSLLARRPYWWLVACSRRLAQRISRAINRDVDPAMVLIDAPPVKLEVDINIDVVGRSVAKANAAVMTLGDVSPVASVLANRQFDNHVKRVRVFVPEDIRTDLRRHSENLHAAMEDWLTRAAEEMENEIA